MKRYFARYKNEWWNIETIFYNKSGNARIRIGREVSFGGYEWELVFEKDLEIHEDKTGSRTG